MKPANDNRTDKDFIYIIASSDQGAFKVGYTAGPSRLANLQTGNPTPLHMLRTIPAERGCEAAIHKALSSYRIRGEWFRGTDLACFLVDDLLDARAGADQCGRLMRPEEARDATLNAIRYFEVGQYAQEDVA
jgi:hypothetical protein